MQTTSHELDGTLEGNGMTRNIEEIYGDYRKADFTDRLHIYLQFPELRDDFLEIEQKEVGTDLFETSTPPAKGLNLIDRLINRTFSFLW